MSTLNNSFGTFDDPTVRKGMRLTPSTQTLAATYTMDADMTPLQLLDPGGAGRTVLLPPETEGLTYTIVNLANADEDLTVKEDGNSTTIATIEQATIGLFYCGRNAAGTLTWYGLTVPQELTALSGYTGSAAELNYLDITTLGTGAASKAVVLDTGEDYTWPATGVLTYGVLADASDTLTASAAELNMAADSSVNTEEVTTTNVITAAESGKTFFLNATTGWVNTLPAPAAGLRYKFVVKLVNTSGNTTIVCNGAASIIEGNVMVASTVVPGVNEASINFIASTTDIGDWVEVISDGTSWFLSGSATTTGGITLT